MTFITCGKYMEKGQRSWPCLVEKKIAYSWILPDLNYSRISSSALDGGCGNWQESKGLSFLLLIMIFGILAVLETKKNCLVYSKSNKIFTSMLLTDSKMVGSLNILNITFPMSIHFSNNSITLIIMKLLAANQFWAQDTSLLSKTGGSQLI